MKCCICGCEIKGYGNNPAPVIMDSKARCCDECDVNLVLPVRMIRLKWDLQEMDNYLNETKGESND